MSAMMMRLEKTGSMFVRPFRQPPFFYVSNAATPKLHDYVSRETRGKRIDRASVNFVRDLYRINES